MATTATTTPPAPKTVKTTTTTVKAPAKPKVAAAKPKATKAAVVADTKAKGSANDDENATTSTADTGTSDTSDATTPSKKKLAVADPEFDRRLEEMLTEFDQVIARARKCKQNGNELKKAYHQQIKEINKRRKVKRTGTAGNSGFQIPSLVRGTKLHDFMKIPHGERIARQAANQAIHQYAKDNGLRLEANQKLFKPDAVLEELIGTAEERRAALEEKKKRDKEGGSVTEITDEVGYFNLQTFIKKWFVTKAEEAAMLATAAIVASDSSSVATAST